MVARCISEGLVRDQRLAVDASLIEADANRQNATEIGVTVEEYETRLVIWPARETGELGVLATGLNRSQIAIRRMEANGRERRKC